ncbi:TrkH family potassium uptake protein [Jeotgalibaca sp. A122]|uniref:TrkH family potassium uptake protein n=1 Tax=Jeotgalibaca sp. A122 TaxID=3457322 RepID=UPI003FD19235
MNKQIVRYVVGRLLQVEALLLILPLIVSFIYKEASIYKMSFFAVIIFLLVMGQLLAFKMPTNTRLTAREGFVIVALSWILFSFFGGLPFVINGDIPSLVDAFFETSSGFTTTGSSILTDVEVLAYSSLFWRSFTHLVGGMGILVFALAILPKIDSQSVNIMKAETPGPTFGKLVSKLSTSARLLYIIYLAMTAVVVLLLYIGGMSFFDSLLHAFGVAGTGGFGIRNGSIAPYETPYFEWVIGFGMLVFGINFNLIYLFLIGKFKQVWQSEELKWYIWIVIGAIGLISLNLLSTYDSILKLIRDVFFTVSSIITTTGFSTADFGQWPLFSQMILLLLMFVGACAGSTAGGLKVSRVVVYAKIFVAEIKRMANPSRIVTVLYDKKSLNKNTKHSVANYLVIYFLLFAGILVLITLDAPDFLSGFSAVAATFNNIGPALGVVGPAHSFAELNDLSKIILSFSMLAGRLEIFPILILFAPRTWKK